ncbi:hypothetical protein FHT77_002474 [Rhizobium sp. BK181]|nr:hypothetical protein [Rhizobium sp. BK181]
MPTSRRQRLPRHTIHATGLRASVILGRHVTAAVPSSAQGLYLIVSDIEAAAAIGSHAASKSARLSITPATLTPVLMNPICSAGSGYVARIRNAAAIAPMPRSMTRTATAGYFRM